VCVPCWHHAKSEQGQEQAGQGKQSSSIDPVAAGPPIPTYIVSCWPAVENAAPPTANWQSGEIAISPLGQGYILPVLQLFHTGPSLPLKSPIWELAGDPWLPATRTRSSTRPWLQRLRPPAHPAAQAEAKPATPWSRTCHRQQGSGLRQSEARPLSHTGDTFLPHRSHR